MEEGSTSDRPGGINPYPEEFPSTSKVPSEIILEPFRFINPTNVSILLLSERKPLETMGKTKKISFGH